LQNVYYVGFMQWLKATWFPNQKWISMQSFIITECETQNGRQKFMTHMYEETNLCMKTKKNYVQWWLNNNLAKKANIMNVLKIAHNSHSR